MNDAIRIPKDFTAEASFDLTLTPEAYADFVGRFTPMPASVTVERRIHNPAPRCAWGWRRGYVQVGSPEDADDLLTLSIPAANFHVHNGHASTTDTQEPA